MEIEFRVNVLSVEGFDWLDVSDARSFKVFQFPAVID